jgi:hypothetical protein
VSGKREARWLHASGERRGHNRQHGFPQQIEFLQAPKKLFESRTGLGRQFASLAASPHHAPNQSRFGLVNIFRNKWVNMLLNSL